MVKVTDLDKRICDIETGVTNTQTYREYIEQSEIEFEFDPADLNSLTDEQLNNYFDFLDDLWLK